MKNKIAFLLVFFGIIGFSLSASAANIPSDVCETEFESGYVILNALGVTGIGEEGLFMPYSRMSRGEFAVMLEKLIQPKMERSGNKYSDVSESHYAASAVDYLSLYGYMVGYGDGTFRPEQEITYNEAVKVCVGLLGYFQIPGADEAFYTNAAASAGLLKGVSSDAGYINKGNVIKLLVNMLDANIMVYDYNKQSCKVDNDKTMLTEICHMYKEKGILEADHYSSITGNSGIGTGKIKINSLEMLYSGEDYVGYDVTCYYFVNDNDEYEARAVIPRADKNNVLEIQADDISKTTSLYTIEYEDEHKKTRQVKYDSNTVFIYNGKNLKNFSVKMLEIKDGYLQTIDNDNDGKAECIKIWEYYNIVVDFANSEKVIDKFDSGKNIIAGDYEEIKVINAEGDVKALSDIKEGMVASAFVSNADSDNIIKLVLSEKSVTGTVTKSYVTNEIQYITIDGKEYAVYSGYKTFAGNEINLNDEGKYLLDIQGKIVTVGEVTYSGYSVGLLAYCNEYMDETSENNIIKLKLFLQDGTLTKFIADDKLSLDGVTYKNNEFDKAWPELETHISEPILYKVDKDGKLICIDTAKQDKQGKLKTIENGISGRYLAATSIIEGKLVIANDVVVFTVPADFDNVTAKDFSTAGHGYFTANSTYNNVKGYSINNGMAADVVVIQGEASIMNHLSEVVLVTGSGTGINSDDEVVDFLEVKENGETKILYEAENGILDKVYKINKYSRAGDTLELVEGRKIEKGDLVKYARNSDGDIEKIAIIYDANEDEMVSVNPYHSDFHEQGNRYVQGYVNEKYDGYIKLVYTSALGADVVEYHNIGKAKIYKVDVESSMMLEEMSLGEISDEVNNNAADKVVIVSNAGVPISAYIYE